MARKSSHIGVIVVFVLRIVGGNIQPHLIGKVRQMKDLFYAEVKVHCFLADPRHATKLHV